ncbi:MAG: UDP-N-acetyl-D-galactosamine dehydrogenase [Gammaproteobacteria bacterium]|jgi:UDP-N-acetyl-D-galactosamine dehydrogenase
MDRKISVVGLGYVGLPAAVAFSTIGRVVGFDINKSRIAELEQGQDSTGEVDRQTLEGSQIKFTSEPDDLRQADFHIIAVPTPIDEAKKPDLSPMISASEIVGAILKTGDIVVYESTVYPGATEEVCLPTLEEKSGLVAGKDFYVGYSPERINPGDKEHTFTKITKVVSAQQPEILEIVAQVYGSVVIAGIHKAPSIKVAEAAKVIENTQRDINISLFNELALIFDRMDIDTGDVIAAAATKWNFLSFRPGLVGGHCIGVDPYYLTHKAEILGYSAQVILSGRRINDGMGDFVASKIIRELARGGGSFKNIVVTVLGFTFKENVPDTRNTRVIDIVSYLKDFGVTVQVHDPVADPKSTLQHYGITLVDRDEVKESDAVILAVAHSEFSQQGWTFIQNLLKAGEGIVFDVQGVLDRKQIPSGIKLLRF